MIENRLSYSGVRPLAWGVALVGLLCLPVLQPASAQQTRTLNIQNGTVYVDGRALAEDQLPDSLDLEGITAQYRFLGIDRPVIELRGRLYAVDEGLTPVTEAEVRQHREAVVLQGGLTQSTSTARSVTTRRDDEDRQYLDAVQRTSRDLYRRLVRERRMERNAEELATTIRLLPDGAARRAKIDTLRAMLDRIFEVKQENRRREIERLERQIRELENSIRQREQMRELMIERRLHQLLESSGRP